MSVLNLLDKPIAFQRSFVRLGVGITGALMLSQAVYWSNRTKEPEGWFYKSQQEWEEETGLTRREQETARRNLKKNGYLEEKKKGVPCKVYYRLNRSRLESDLLDSCANAPNSDGVDVQTRMAECAKLDCTNSPNSDGGMSQTITENTTENTTENKNTSRKALDYAFEKFWSAGMVKTGKKTAKAKFEKLIREGKLDPDEFAIQLVRDVQARLQAGVFGFDKLHPTTYLNQERWEDEIVGDNTATVHRMSDYLPNSEEYCSRGPVRGRAIPSGCDQPDDNGILTLPDSTQCRIEDWDAGLIQWDGARSIVGGRQ